MKINPASASTMMSDEQLWQRSRTGDREAFGQIVERYQSLVCSLAYSASGNLLTSEDLAQETFVTAWQQLGHLREPSKLRAWLCGIVRNLAATASRRQRRRGGPTESLEKMVDQATTEADPAAYAVTQEEAALLWNALASLPPIYRDPLVLFYRQEQSIAEVAASLELSDDAVKQRLSRGRILLREEMALLVESTLTRTRPGATFTTGVLVALQIASAPTAGVALTAGAAAGSSANVVGKGFLATFGLSNLVGPLIGLISGYLAAKAVASTARTPEERNCILRHVRYGVMVFCWVMAFGLVAVLSQAGKFYTASAPELVAGISLWTVSLVGGIILISARMDREVRKIRILTGTTDETYANDRQAQSTRWRLPAYFESKWRLFGLPLFALSWAGMRSDAKRPRVSCAWIAVGDIAVSPLLALGQIAVGPIAVGAITVGLLSLSLWGLAFGGFAVGGLAFGWWSVGFASAGIRFAAGFAAVARDYAVGLVASATETATTATQAWIKSQGLAEFGGMIHHLPWWIIGCMAVALILRTWRVRRERTNPNSTAPSDSA